jgi:hypothetical protein
VTVAHPSKVNAIPQTLIAPKNEEGDLKQPLLDKLEDKVFQSALEVRIEMEVWGNGQYRVYGTEINSS